MKRILTASFALAIAACSSHLPAPSRSVVASDYVQTADANASTATLTVETAEPVTLLTYRAYDSASQIACPASLTTLDWAQASSAAVENHNGAVIPRYETLHLLPNEVQQDGDHVERLNNVQTLAQAYTDDGHSGAICWFQLRNLRIIASQ